MSLQELHQSGIWGISVSPLTLFSTTMSRKKTIFCSSLANIFVSEDCLLNASGTITTIFSLVEKEKLTTQKWVAIKKLYLLGSKDVLEILSQVLNLCSCGFWNW